MKKFEFCPFCEKPMENWASGDVMINAIPEVWEWRPGTSDCNWCWLWVDVDDHDIIISVEKDGQKWSPEEFERFLKLRAFE